MKKTKIKKQNKLSKGTMDISFGEIKELFKELKEKGVENVAEVTRNAIFALFGESVSIIDSKQFEQVKTVLTGIDSMYLKEAFLIAIEEAKRDENWAKYIVPRLIKTGKIDEEILNKAFLIAIEEAKRDENWAKYIVPELIKTGKIDEKLVKGKLTELFLVAIEKAKRGRYWAEYIVPELIKIDKIDEEILNKAFLIAIEEAKRNEYWAEYIVPELIKTGKIDKEILKEAFLIAIEEAKRGGYWAKYIVPELIKVLQTLVIEVNYNNYDDNERLILDIIKSLPNGQILNFVYYNRFDKEVLTIIKEFINEYREIIDIEFFTKHIREIGFYLRKGRRRGKEGLAWGYFVEKIKNLKSVEATAPVNYENFLDFMKEDEFLFQEPQDKIVKSKGPIPWTKAWFEEDPERINLIRQPGKSILWEIVVYNLGDYFIHNLSDYNIIERTINKRVERSRDAQRILSSFKGYDTYVYRRFLEYVLKNKNKEFVSFIQKLLFIEEYKIGININKFKTLRDYIKNGQIEEDKLRKDYEKVLNILEKKDKEKKLRKLNNALKAKDYNIIRIMLMEIQYEYFKYLYQRKIEIKIKADLKEFLAGVEIKDEKINNPLFIEAYKMYMGTKINKGVLGELLAKYLKGEEGLYQYNTERNKEWLKSHLTKEQQEIWLSRNEKIYEVEKNNTDIGDGAKVNIEGEIKDKLQIAIKKIKEINELGFEFETEFEDASNLIGYFFKVIKKKEKEIKAKSESTNLYEDLKLQIDRIQELRKKLEILNKQRQREITHIKIYMENDPLRALMMGNWVKGSCLSFYSPVGNYWSAITNAVDVNKRVCYIEGKIGDSWVLLGRVLIAIDEDRRLMRFKMYYAKDGINVDLNKHFNKYFLDLAKKMGLEINGDQYNVKLIEGEEWYKDGTVYL